MSTVKGLCPGRFKNGRPCVVRPRFGKVCSYHRKFGRHSRAVASARDELVRAAVALDAAFTDHETPTDAWSMVAARKLAWADHRAAVAAYAKLEKP